MNLTAIVALNMFAFLILMLIWLREYKLKGQSIANRIFMYIVYATLILLVVDPLAWVFNLQPGENNLFLNVLFNFLLYALAPVPVLLWMCYTNYQIFSSQAKLKRQAKFLWLLLMLNLVILVISLKTGWYFYIDATNAYHRGEYFGVHVALCYGVLLYATYLIIANRKSIKKKHFFSLLLFPVPMMMGSVLQVMFYGLSLNWPSAALSILIIYFNIQDLGLNTDYLTGASNRRLLDLYLKEKIEKSNRNKTFSAILIDLDKFKQINDTFGHHVGDEALQDMVQILRSCVRNEDLVARLGGDEFYIIMNIAEKAKMEQVVERLNKAAEDFNRTNRKPYKINFSMGYDIYDPASEMGVDDFMKHLDQLMYHHKKQRATVGA